MHVESTLIYNNPEPEATRMSLSRGRDRQMMVYAYNGIAPIRKEKRTTDTCNGMDESQIISQSEICQTTKEYILQTSLI